ncbi:MAG TPA: TetR/AcrR family transcriptional regulator [Candidatus Kryptonia bacterium]|nr:TetR/AcrR family transcriptional regulator [Candidatus Kryptonia bacterium]
MAVTQLRDPRTDGRLARSVGTRAAVVDALLALLHEGDLRPTAPRIAARAGISVRSVFQHFPDMEAIFAAVADRQTARIRALGRPISCDGTLASRSAALVAQRARIFEIIAPVRRAAVLMEPFSPEIAKRLCGARMAARREIERVFAREIAARPRSDRGELLAALDAASSWTMWDALRTHQGLTVERARKAMIRILAALLNREVATRRRRLNGHAAHA